MLKLTPPINIIFKSNKSKSKVTSERKSQNYTENPTYKTTLKRGLN